MTISYNWLSEYLPIKIEPERLSKILTSVGLEVEKMEPYEEIIGGLKGLVIGEVLETAPHPNADKLTLTKVNVGAGEPLKIVCGAPNVAAGQKVVVATTGTTIYPINNEPLTMKVAKIRGEESHGMICAEDEIGLGDSHAGIMVLPPDARPGTPAAEYFNPYQDVIYEIGITPNRMDAMSHLGVARDVCAYLSFHEKRDYRPKMPFKNGFKPDNTNFPITISVENEQACPRYSGLTMQGIKVSESPKWMQQRLKAIGIRPLNNIVDITNYIQHETGQPLHAFDADKIKGQAIKVKNLAEGSSFITLDEKQRKLSAEDLMICNDSEPMCMAGIFGGLASGVTENTTRIFIESACFDPGVTRKSSFRHNLRTDAASRFEKGVDISNTINVLKRAALLVKEVAGGEISSEITDIYPNPQPKTEIGLKYHYLKKISGKNYHPDAVKNILQSLGFEVIKERIDEIWVAVPYHKPDISLPADLVEEILRIDGLDNIEIHGTITISPSVEEDFAREKSREKVADYLAGSGFHQIITNSITNSAYYTEEELSSSVKMINNLSEELNMMRLCLLETGLESIAYNLNRKNDNLHFFEFGKIYQTIAEGKYEETEHLLLLTTGKQHEQGWRQKAGEADFYYLKGIAGKILKAVGVTVEKFETTEHKQGTVLCGYYKREVLFTLGSVAAKTLSRFDIRQTVFFLDINWEKLMQAQKDSVIRFREISRFPVVQRDLSMVVPSSLPYAEVENNIRKLRLSKLASFHLFDVFEHEKLGAGKKSLAINFNFVDEEKTLTDKEIDSWMNKLIISLEKDLSAEIRK